MRLPLIVAVAVFVILATLTSPTTAINERDTLPQSGAAANATQPWVIKWDADYILYGEEAMRKFQRTIKLCDRVGRYSLRYYLPRVDSDLEHVNRNFASGQNPETWAFKRGAAKSTKARTLGMASRPSGMTK